MKNIGIAVIGSMTVDLVAEVKNFPQCGQTLIGTGFTLVSGGKGSNQAVMAANMGIHTKMIGCVGDDFFGHVILSSLQSHHVNVENVKILSNQSTGVAHIRVDENGNNDIVMIPMANLQTNQSHVDEFFSQNPDCNVLLLQLEIPVETVYYAAKRAKSLQLKVVLDPAPAMEIPADLYYYVDVMTPNEGEASLLTGIEVTDIQSAERAAKVLRERGVATVIITLGSKGVLLVDEKGTRHYAAFNVNPIDTTAAGDAFTGTLGVCMAKEMSMDDAVKYSMAAGALTVTKLGAQSSLPLVDEVESLLIT